MEKITIQTAQNIDIEQPVASIGERILANLLDYIFFFCYIIIISIIKEQAGLDGTTFGIITMLPILFYHLFSETFAQGQSWGKKIVKIKVMKIDGTQAKAYNYFVRWIFRIIDVSLLFGSIATLTIIINGKGQRLGDIAANTTIVRIRKAALQKTIFKEIPEDYEVIFPEVRNLSPQDVYTVKEVLDYLIQKGFIEDSAKYAIETKKKIENKLTINSDMVPVKFLETILNDYNKIHS